MTETIEGFPWEWHETGFLGIASGPGEHMIYLCTKGMSGTTTGARRIPEGSSPPDPKWDKIFYRIARHMKTQPPTIGWQKMKMSALEHKCGRLSHPCSDVIVRLGLQHFPVEMGETLEDDKRLDEITERFLPQLTGITLEDREEISQACERYITEVCREARSRWSHGTPRPNRHSMMVSTSTSTYSVVYIPPSSYDILQVEGDDDDGQPLDTEELHPAKECNRVNLIERWATSRMGYGVPPPCDGLG